MSISQLCAAAQDCVLPRIINAFTTVSILLILTATSFAATLVVPAGGDLQAAINTAVPGDTIVLEAGATYRGPFTLPAKSGNSFITIQSSRAAEITGRVTPSQSALLARLRSNSPAQPIIKTDPGAHHYNLIGLELSTFAASDFIYDLVRLGAGDPSQTDLSIIPHHLILDRLWVHGFATQEVQRGISLNSAETSIINSYISEIHALATDTQAICGWNGPGPYHIINNYLEAAGENVMFGGADPAIVDLVPSNIEIRRNHFFKPLRWKIGDPSYAGIPWTIKNLFETKNARNLIIDGNIFENNWTQAQVGFAILLKTANQDGSCYWCVSENITFSNNTIKAEKGINILGRDGYPTRSGVDQNRLRIINNLWQVDAIWFQGGDGTRDVIIDHNTFFSKLGNTMTLYGRLMTPFVMTNTVGVRAGYGIKGDGTGEGTAALDAFAPGWVFQRNVIAGASASSYPANNFYPATLDGVFVDAASGNYRINSSSSYKNAGTDGKDPGCDIDALLAAQSGSAPTPTPIPTPTPTPTPAPAPDSFIQFSAATYSVNEDAGSITITLTRTGSTTQSASVSYSSSDVSAVSGSDYDVAPGTLTFSPGESTRTFSVSITNDTLVESTETFDITLSNVPNAKLGTPATAVVSIVDNDKPPPRGRNKTPRGVVTTTRRILRD